MFDLPDSVARLALVRQYFNLYCKRAGDDARSGPFGLFRRQAARIAIAPDVDDAYLASVADLLDGFSGREISKLFISVQGSAYGSASSSPLVDRRLVEEVVGWKLAEHIAKGMFGSMAYDFAAYREKQAPSSVAAAVLSPPAQSSADAAVSKLSATIGLAPAAAKSAATVVMSAESITDDIGIDLDTGGRISAAKVAPLVAPDSELGGGSASSSVALPHPAAAASVSVATPVATASVVAAAVQLSVTVPVPELR